MKYDSETERIYKELIKEVALVIPTVILKDTNLKERDKLVFGLHYAYFKKEGATYLTNIQIGEQLQLHYNDVGKSHKTLLQRQLLVKEDNVFKVVEETVVEMQKSIEGAQQIILPYLVYSKKLNKGAMLLWGEYNKFKNQKEGYFAKRQTTAENIGVSLASVTNWSKELEDADLIHTKTFYRGVKKQKTVYMIDLNEVEAQRKKLKDELREQLGEEPTPLQIRLAEQRKATEAKK